MKKRFKYIADRCLRWTLAIVMIFTQLSVMPEAAFDVAAADETVNTNSVTFNFKHQSGGREIEETDEDGNTVVKANTIMIGRNQYANYYLEANADFSRGEASNVYYDIHLPYFYYKIEDGKKVMHETYNVNEVPAEQKGLYGVGIKLNDPASVQRYSEYDPETGFGAKKAISPSTSKIYMGTVRFYTSKKVIGGTPTSLDISIGFKCNPDDESDKLIPENYVALAYCGGGYEKYKDNNTELGEYYTSSFDKDANKLTLICSNLNWEIKCSDFFDRKNVLWDKYNYLLCQAEIQNTSEETDDTSIDAFEFRMNVPMSDPSDADTYGMSYYNARRWKLNEDTNQYEQTDDNNYMNQGGIYIGKPAAGGVLIYDITGIDEDTMEKWDTTGFTNIKDKDGNVLTPLPYKVTQSGKKGNVILEINKAESGVNMDDSMHIGPK